MLIPGLGEEGQRRLAAARVFVLGAGGIGFPVLTYLAAAGVGRIVFVDRDRVEPSNLNRQCLFAEADLGRPKAEAASERLRGLNSEVDLVALHAELTPTLADAHLAGCDLALDCADNHAARMVLATACHRLGVAVLHGAVAGFEGTLGLLDSRSGPCLGCLYPAPVGTGNTPVIGAAVGVVGSLMATAAIRHLARIGRLEPGRLLLLDLERGAFDWVRVEKDRGCPVCSAG